MERRITDGGRELRAYLTRERLSVPRFCEQNGLDRIQVQRVLNGDRWQRISVDFAASIAAATGDKVSWSSFLSKTATAPTSEAA